MWFILNVFFLFIVGNVVSEWPDCGNFAFAKGYPIGCAQQPNQCVEQNDECKKIMCEDIKKEFRECGEACNDSPEESPIVLNNGNVCWCLKDVPPSICFSPPPDLVTKRLMARNHTAHEIQHTAVRKKVDGQNIWGAMVQMPGTLLIPAFCYDKKDTCGEVPRVCEPKSCMGPDACYFNGICYYLDQQLGQSEVRCSRGYPTSIESTDEWEFFTKLITDAWIATNGQVSVATDGIVKANSKVIEWKSWPLSSTEVVYSIIGNSLGDIVEQSSERVLVFQRATSSDSIYWYLQEAPELIDFRLCKESTETTTTLSSTTEQTETTTISLYTTTTASVETTAELEKTTNGFEETTTEDIEVIDSTTMKLITEETTSALPFETTKSTPRPQCIPKCNKVDQYGVNWICCENMTCAKMCPLGAFGVAFWSCDVSQIGNKWPNYSNCVSPWLGDIDELIESGGTSLDLMMTLDQYLDESSMFGKDMIVALGATETALGLLYAEQSETVMELTTQISQINFHTQLALRTVDKILNLQKPWEQLTDVQRIALGKRTTEVLELYGFAMTEKAAELGGQFNVTHVSLNSHMEAQYLLLNNSLEIDALSFPMEKNEHKSSITITSYPADLQSLQLVGTNTQLKFVEKMFPAKLNSFSDESKQINADMISMTVRRVRNPRSLHNFESQLPVVVTFRHARQAKGPAHSEVGHALYPGERPTAIQGTAVCVYWDASKGDGQWNTDGCRVLSSSHWHTVCECNHLSSFALLMDVHGYIAQSKALEVLGIVCSALSVVCLAMTLLVLNVLKLKYNERNSIGKHLCLCLMVGHLLALIFIDRTYFNMPQEMCVFIGVVLHYVFLAAFMWMTIEGHHLYHMLVKVFHSGRDFTRIYFTLGYGVPAIIVAITGIVTACLQDTGYGNDDMCWLSAPGYIWAFMGPVLLLIIINILVLIIAMKVAISASKKQKKKLLSRLKIWLRGWFSISALLGVTWIFGFLYIHVDRHFAYFFVILNGCQGIFIFLSRVVMNKQVREALKESYRKRELLSQFYGMKRMSQDSEYSSRSPWVFTSAASSKTDLSISASTLRKKSIISQTNRRRSSTNESGLDMEVYSYASTIDMKPGTLAGASRRKSREEARLPSHQYIWSSAAEMKETRVSWRDTEDLFHIPEEDY